MKPVILPLHNCKSYNSAIAGPKPVEKRGQLSIGLAPLSRKTLQPLLKRTKIDTENRRTEERFALWYDDARSKPSGSHASDELYTECNQGDKNRHLEHRTMFQTGKMVQVINEFETINLTFWD